MMNLSSQAERYCNLVCQLDDLHLAGEGETEKASQLCDQCDELWLSMSEDEHAQAEVRIRQIYNERQAKV